MMHGIEERREVAARLRSLANVALRGCDDPVEFIELLDMELFDYGPNPMSDFALRLADLIEPEPERTCRVVTERRPVSQTQGLHVKSCSECGYVFGSEEHRPLLPGLDKEIVLDSVQIPNYCPHCGARVVER